jgi:hypothetical protein
MPTRDEIAPQVITILQSVTLEDDLAQIETSNLKDDLGISPSVKTLLSVPYTKVSRTYPLGIDVTMTPTGNCKTVKDSIDLVFRRSNGNT